jgi:hypothetical protein
MDGSKGKDNESNRNGVSYSRDVSNSKNSENIMIKTTAMQCSKDVKIMKMPTTAQYTSMLTTTMPPATAGKPAIAEHQQLQGRQQPEGTQARTSWRATEETTVITTSNAIAPEKVTAEWLAKKELNQ